MDSGVKGVPQLEARLRAVGSAQVPKTILRDWQVRTTQLAKVYAPKRSGNLKRSIHPGSLTPTSARVEASANYAGYMEFGTKPHDIRPLVKKALAWGGVRRLSGALAAGSKATNFAKLVRHPGTAPRPFMAPAGREAAQDIGPATIITAWNDAAT